MKLKRFLALAVSLAMVITMIPAFSLTASAALDTSWISDDTLVYDGTQTDSAYGQGKQHIAVEFTLGTVSGYKDLAMTDADGKKIAGFCDAWLSGDGFYVPDGERSAAADNTVVSTSSGNIKYNDYSGSARVRALIENTGSQYTVEYSVIDGIGGAVVKTFATMVYSGTANGISLPANWNYGGWGSGVSASNASSAFTDFRVYAYSPATVVSVTATYKAGTETITTITKSYNTANGETSVAFDEMYYRAIGTNTLYYAAATTLTASGDVEMTALDNWGNYAVGDSIASGSKGYTVKSANLVPNGNFEYDMNGWYNRANSTPPTTYTITTTDKPASAERAAVSSGCGGASSTNSIKQAWDITPGTTYYYSLWVKAGDQWHGLGESASATAESQTLVANGGFGTSSAWVNKSGVFTATNEYLVFFEGWSSVGLADVELYEVEEKIETTDATVKASLDALTLPLATKTDLTLPTTATDAYSYKSTVTWTSANTDVVANDGTVTNPAEPTTVALTPSTTFEDATVTGEAINVVVFPASVAGTEYNSGSGVYTIGTDNIVATAGTAASFEGDGAIDLTGWYAHTGVQTNSAIFSIDGTTEVVPDGNWAYASKWSDGITGTNYCTIDTMWAVEAGTYYFSFYTKKENSTNGQVYVYFSEDNAHHTSVSSITSEAWVEKVTPGTAWEKKEYVITAETAGYIGITGYNLSDGANGSRGTFFDDFELYTATQMAEELASVPEVGAEVTVIAGNTPILPGTVTGKGTLGSDMPVAVVWDTTGLSFATAGTVEVPGTVTDTAYTTKAVVTVLAETFSVADSASKNGQPGNVVYFPVEIADEFTVEFDLTVVQLTDVSVQMGYNGTMFSAAALGISPNGGTLKVTGGSKNGSAGIGHTLATVVNKGDTFRILLTMDASDDTYSITATAADGTSVTVTEQGFRQAQDAINTMTLVTNGSGSMGDTAADGDILVSNIKVNSTVTKNDYTVSITMDGETSTTTMSAWTAKALAESFNDQTGYEKTVTYDEDAKTVTVVYTAVYTAKATFIDANENVVKVVEEVKYSGETVTVNAEEIFFLDVDYNGYFYQIPETTISEENNNLLIAVSETANKYAVKEDALITGTSEIWGVKKTNNNSVFVASAWNAEEAPKNDANGETITDGTVPSTLGTSRKGYFLFPVVDLEEGQSATAYFYVREWHVNGFSNGNTSLRLGAYAVTDHSWAELSDGDTTYVSADAPVLETWATPVYSTAHDNSVGYITFDVTEVMMAAKAAGMSEITLKLTAGYGAAYIAEREAAVVGGTYAGKAAYVLVEDADLVKVTETGSATLTKNGSAMNGFAYVNAADDVRLVGDGAVVVNTDAGYYYANKTMTISEATAFENTVPAGLGLAMVSGAQVRIGAEDLGEGEKLDALSDSGIRFLATANYTDTVLADDAVEFGIKVQAESSATAAYVKAEKFQNEDNNVFSAAITNMKESNYNRNYTATAYAKVPMADGTVAELTTDSVTRSIYQVSAGIMQNGSADADNAAYTVDGVVKNILNAYVNQTGIRLTYTADGITVEEGKYTGAVFFEVEFEVNEDGSVAVIITPDTTWGTPAEIATWWKDYVRVNNNNSVAKTYISDAEVVDGVLTFTFTVPATE